MLPEMRAQYEAAVKAARAVRAGTMTREEAVPIINAYRQAMADTYSRNRHPGARRLHVPSVAFLLRAL